MRKSAQACGLVSTSRSTLRVSRESDSRKDPEVRKSKFFNFRRKDTKIAPKSAIFSVFEVPKMGQFELFRRGRL